MSLQGYEPYVGLSENLKMTLSSRGVFFNKESVEVLGRAGYVIPEFNKKANGFAVVACAKGAEHSRPFFDSDKAARVVVQRRSDDLWDAILSMAGLAAGDLPQIFAGTYHSEDNAITFDLGGKPGEGKAAGKGDDKAVGSKKAGRKKAARAASKGASKSSIEKSIERGVVPKLGKNVRLSSEMQAKLGELLRPEYEGGLSVREVAEKHGYNELRTRSLLQLAGTKFRGRKKAAEKPADKPAEKAVAKETGKPAAKASEKPASGKSSGKATGKTAEKAAAPKE